MPSGIYERTEEHNRKNSEARKGMKFSEEHKRKLSKAGKGKIIPEETRRKISKTIKKCWQDGRCKGLTNTNHSEKTKLKISKANKGKHLSINSEFRKGKKHRNWQGGISFEPYTYEFNKQLKELIRQRDGYKCQLCGVPEIENIRKLDIHHIDYVKKNCLPNNLITLCKRCNGKVNSNRDFWEEYFKKIILEKDN